MRCASRGALTPLGSARSLFNLLGTHGRGAASVRLADGRGVRRTVGGNEVPIVVYELTQLWRHLFKKTFTVFLKQLLLNYN